MERRTLRQLYVDVVQPETTLREVVDVRVPEYVCDGCNVSCEVEVHVVRRGAEAGKACEATSWSGPVLWMRASMRERDGNFVERHYCQNCVKKIDEMLNNTGGRQ